MPQRSTQQGQQLAENLARLAKSYKTSDPTQAADYKRAFKDLSKNDLSRTIVYLMEVVGSRDIEFKKIEEENKDLKEILKLNNINLDEDEKVSTGEAAVGGENGSASTASNTGDESGGVLPTDSANNTSLAAEANNGAA